MAEAWAGSAEKRRSVKAKTGFISRESSTVRMDVPRTCSGQNSINDGRSGKNCRGHYEKGGRASSPPLSTKRRGEYAQGGLIEKSDGKRRGHTESTVGGWMAHVSR